MTVKTLKSVKNAPVCTVKTSQLTGFDHFSYFPQKFRYRTIVRNQSHVTTSPPNDKMVL